ncbi:MAG TPA: hypothetical protein VFW13_01455, partial [Phenylobacterium sp.]|nr:hypothetical protein [Phenylobacterium sp.]
LVLYLISAAALPDEVPAGPIDLRAHYLAVSRRLWLLFVVQGLLTASINTWVAVRTGANPSEVLTAYYVILPAAFLLAMIRTPALHVVGLIALSGFYAFQYFGQVLGG